MDGGAPIHMEEASESSSAPPRKVMLVFGTRPEAVKVAPLILALTRAPGMTPVVVVTAQHRGLLDQVLEVFGVTPRHDLNILQEGQTLASITERALQGLSPLITLERPDLVVVQGDTTTTFAGALAAFYQRVPVAHLEAGLRTGDRYSPYPEEINRRLTTQLSALHLAPTPLSGANLLAEGVAKESVVVTGNTVIDALLWTVARQMEYGDPALAGLDNDRRRVLLVTAHRRESWGAPMGAIGRALARLARTEPELLIVFPIHPNPVVREAILPALEGLANVLVVEPLPYSGFCRLMERSHLILTDSGGIQEEGPSLGKPVLVLRSITERPEAVAAGTVALVGTEEDRIFAKVGQLLHDEGAYQAMARAVNPYGDGRAADRATAAIRHFFGDGPRPEEFGLPADQGHLGPSDGG